MLKNYFLFWCFILLLCACSCNRHPIETKLPVIYSLKDSLLKEYFLTCDTILKTDSRYFDSNDYNYRMLKAYYLNDTSLLRRYTNDSRAGRKEFFRSASFNAKYVPDLRKMEVDEGYQFLFIPSFCPYKYLLTITQDSGKVNLNTIIYRTTALYDDSVVLETVRKFNKKLSIKEWERFNEAIILADFWNLKAHVDHWVLDPDYLTVHGLRKNNSQTKILDSYTVDRGPVYGTALYNAFLLLVKISGIPGEPCKRWDTMY